MDFLLTKGVEFLGAVLIFAVRIALASNQPATAAAARTAAGGWGGDQQLQQPLRALAFLYISRVPRIPNVNCLKLA